MRRREGSHGVGACVRGAAPTPRAAPQPGPNLGSRARGPGPGGRGRARGPHGAGRGPPSHWDPVRGQKFHRRAASHQGLSHEAFKSLPVGVGQWRSPNLV